MTKKTPSPRTAPPEAVISIIGAGMTLVGDTDTDGSLRVEGTIRGNVRAGKSVVVGRGGFVDGSVFTQDAVIAGRVSGGIHAESRLELQATSEVAGEIVAPRMQVEEGAKVQGQVAIGESAVKAAGKAAAKSGKPQKASGGGGEVEPDFKPGVDDEGKAEPDTEPEADSTEKKAGDQKESEEPGGGGRAGRQTGSSQLGTWGDEATEPESSSGGKAEPQKVEKRKPESEGSEEELHQPSSS